MNFNIFQIETINISTKSQFENSYTCYLGIILELRISKCEIFTKQEISWHGNVIQNILLIPDKRHLFSSVVVFIFQPLGPAYSFRNLYLPLSTNNITLLLVTRSTGAPENLNQTKHRKVTLSILINKQIVLYKAASFCSSMT